METLIVAYTPKTLYEPIEDVLQKAIQLMPPISNKSGTQGFAVMIA